MDREQLIRGLRQIQNVEDTTFGDMGDPTCGKAANLLEQDELDILALEGHSAKTINQANKNYGCLLFLFAVVYLGSITSIICYYHYIR